jgi:hypothetical protein
MDLGKVAKIPRMLHLKNLINNRELFQQLLLGILGIVGDCWGFVGIVEYSWVFLGTLLVSSPWPRS